MKNDTEPREPSRIFYYPNMVVRVYEPDITDEENARRMKRLHDAAAELLKDVIQKKRMKNAEKTEKLVH